jgi:transcriptional regulator with PAS, ATPase and Fis domain
MDREEPAGEEDLMYCVYCGAKTERTMSFCGTCGKPVKQAEDIIIDIKNGFKAKQYDGIIEKIRALEGARPQAFIKKLKGDLAFIKGNYREAYEHYGGLDDKDRKWDILFNLGLIDLTSGRTKDALEHLSAIPAMDIDLSSSFLYYERYEKREVFLADVFLYLGVIYRSLNKNDEAVQSFEKTISFSPSNELALANLGDMMFKDDNYDSAISYYKRSIAAGNDDMKKSHLNNDLGLAYFRKGLIEDAINSFKNAIMLNSDNKNAVYNLGLIYVKSGMQDKVKDDYKEFLKHESGIDIVFNLTKSIMDVAKQESAGDMDMDFLGNDESVKRAKEIIWKAAATDSTVFIQGENGTGKELAARAIHKMSKRSSKPFIVVNCGALPETLLESELFGHEKGAFTGAIKDKPGRFELAEGGTVFLDEIGDITQAMQVKLLRFVQFKEFERVGGTTTLKVDVRIITATNKDVKKLVEDGCFREDLYYRLYVLPLIMPPLRDRGRDILLLAEYFLLKFSEKNKKEFRNFSAESAALLNAYAWPGNVRQLENVIERIVTLNDGQEVVKGYLPEEIIDSGKSDPDFKKSRPSKSGTDEEKQKVINVLIREKNSKTKAAKALGISRVALWKKMKKMGIE